MSVEAQLKTRLFLSVECWGFEKYLNGLIRKYISDFIECEIVLIRVIFCLESIRCPVGYARKEPAHEVVLFYFINDFYIFRFGFADDFK